MRMCLNVFLRFAGLYKKPFVVDGIRISVNGKINGRDRSINHLIFKTSLKDNQLTKIDWLCLKVDYSCIQAKSRYGSFALRV
jgi:ribosomal protein S3